jgi:YidC/Oxa1 family membrane protein insertase
VRLLLLPLTLLQVRAERARAGLAPKVAELRERYTGDAAALSRETLGLYRAAGVSPFAGLGPGLAQAPFFLVMYRLFLSPTAGGGPNELLTRTLWGVPLGERWISGSLFGPHDWVFLAVFAALAVFAWWSSRRLRGAPMPLLRLLPYATVLVAASVPLAAALYLVTTAAWTNLENAVLRRGGIDAAGTPTPASPGPGTR